MQHHALIILILVIAEVACCPDVSLAAERDSKSGLYAIWYSASSEKYLSQPYIKGGQIVLQWADIETSKGKYDFSQVEEKLAELHQQGLFATIQINGNQKPAWLFDQVPYLEERLSVQVRDSKGTLMFWHPTHRIAYQRMLRAFADHLRNSQHGNTLLGLRMNLNAIGTEHHYIEPKHRALDQWIVPDGVNRMELAAWSRELTDHYIEAVMDTYIDAFQGAIRVFVRNGISDELEEKYRDAFENGTLSWFHTSSEAEPRSSGTERRYQRFVEDCRSGKTTAYAEPWASTWGHHGGKRDDRWCSPPQWGYWRLLLDLHCGVSYIALYATDMRVAIDGSYSSGGIHYHEPGGAYQREFEAAFRFADKYVGYHACPDKSPGAWVAFRQNNTIRAANGISEAKRHLSVFNDDYDFLMRRLPGDSSHGENVVNVGPDDQRFGAWARVLPAGESVRLKVNQVFVDSLPDRGSRMNVTYLDQDVGRLHVSVGDQSMDVVCRGTNRWQTASLEVPSGKLNADHDGSHLRLTATESPIYLHMVEVERL
ncbi:Beta-galactosidase [Planctomycetes bacterium CA13]|uniref:Beta-galactosidase n=1 Tax=Novipirellula herctigrandis TaxID=2527986 RepID=A0A5C5YUR4_9BACT|nr:Beta-galactosidase [Planctomycetes bacterium CA13]